MLVAFMFIARMLGKEAFGEPGIIRSTVGVFGTLAGFGLGLTATKHIAEFRRCNPERAGRLLALSNLLAIATSALMGLALLILAPWLAAETLHACAFERASAAGNDDTAAHRLDRHADGSPRWVRGLQDHR